MELNPLDLEDWIAALGRDPEARVKVPPPDGLFPFTTEPAEWGLSMYATAYFYMPTDEDVKRVAVAVPQLYAEFGQLTQHSLAQLQHPKTGQVYPAGHKSLPAMDEYFLSGDLATITAFGSSSEESSPRFAVDAVCSFKASSRPGGKVQRLSHLSVRFPLAHWHANKRLLIEWWFKALELLKPEQAHMGLAFGNPPILERYPFIEQSEFALAKSFYGLDIDKPMFMTGSPFASHKNYLEQGTRTPTFGTLMRGKYLEQLGGETALREALADEPRILIKPCGDGLWLQAGEAPALYPVEEGIPTHVARLAQVLKPTRLDNLWLISYLPALPREDCFMPATARRWLKRFDQDGDWPSPGVRYWQGQPDGAASEAAARSRTLRCLPGEVVPRDGLWTALALRGESGRRIFKTGQRFPDLDVTSYGAVIWHWDESQQG